MMKYIFVLCLLFSTGCVERVIKISSQPSGALVWLNDREIGRTPLAVTFTFYGDYDVVIRKEGFNTIKTSKVTPTPWYEKAGIDFFSECLWPQTIIDEHVWSFELETLDMNNEVELLKRGKALQSALESSSE